MALGRPGNPDFRGTASHGLGPGGFLHFGSLCSLVGHVDSRESHRIVHKCAGTGGFCSVSGQNMSVLRLSRRAQKFSSSRNHTRPLRLSSALAVTLTTNARRCQRTHPLRGMGDYSLNAPKDIGLGVTDLALACGLEPLMDAVCTAVVGSARTGPELDAGSDREDRSSDVCYVGDKR